MNINLTHKRALIGGSTQGIGLAIAQLLAEMGASCTLVARNEERLHKAVDTLKMAHPQQHHCVVADYADPNDLAQKVRAYVDNNPVHILINNTGGPSAGPIINATPEQFINTYEQHLICNHLLTQITVPGMKAAGFGRIINIISTSVKIPLNNLGVSNTVRGAVASWAKTMANELGEFNITVNNVLPGFTSTERLESLIKHTMKETGKSYNEVKTGMIKDVPVKRFGKAEEIAAVAAFLASEAASYVNGVSIPVDGGRTGSI